MATSTRTNDTKTITPDFEAATEQIRETSDRFVAAGRKVTNAYLDGVERYVAELVKAERKIGEQSQVGPFGQILTAHAALTEDVVQASLAATRDLVSA